MEIMALTDRVFHVLESKLRAWIQEGEVFYPEDEIRKVAYTCCWNMLNVWDWHLTHALGHSPNLILGESLLPKDHPQSFAEIHDALTKQTWGPFDAEDFHDVLLELRSVMFEERGVQTLRSKFFTHKSFKHICICPATQYSP